MFVDILVAIALGVCAGIVTGLIPGIHINLVSALLISYSAFFLEFSNPLTIAVFVISMSITHAFVDMIPSVYLGAPDPSTVLVVLPAHRMLFEGKGHAAIVLTLIGSMASLVLMVALLPALIFIFPKVYTYLLPNVGVILLFIVGFMIVREDNFSAALVVSCISGIFGILVFSLNIENPLFPMLSGLFGISTLVASISTRPIVPKQDFSYDYKGIFFPSVISLFSGSLTTIFPGIGAAHASIIGTQFMRKISQDSYLVLVGGIGSVSMASSLISFFTLEKARNGSIIAVKHFLSSLSFELLVLMCAVSILSGALAFLISVRLSRIAASKIAMIDYNKICWCVILIVFLLVFIMAGWLGLVVLIIGSVVGLLPYCFNIGKSHCMSCLLIPVISYFF